RSIPSIWQDARPELLGRLCILDIVLGADEPGVGRNTEPVFFGRRAHIRVTIALAESSVPKTLGLEGPFIQVDNGLRLEVVAHDRVEVPAKGGRLSDVQDGGI